MEIMQCESIVLNQDELLSIIIPAYNAEKYISSTIECLLNQTYQKIEIIVINDGSTDNTEDIILSFNDYRIKYIYISNKGAFQARLVGLQNASGEFVGFVDADDIVELDMFERLMVNAKKYDADISHCGYKTVVSDGDRMHYFYNTGKILLQDNYSGVKDLLEGKFIEPSLWNKIYRRKLFNVLLSTDIVEKKITINEDLLINYFLFKESQRSIYEDFCGYLYFSREGTITRSEKNIEKIEDPLRVWKIIYRDAYENFTIIVEKGMLVRLLDLYISYLYIGGDLERKKELRIEIFKFKHVLYLMGKNFKAKYFLSIYFPSIYKMVNYIHTKYFQKKIYE